MTCRQRVYAICVWVSVLHGERRGMVKDVVKDAAFLWHWSTRLKRAPRWLNSSAREVVVCGFLVHEASVHFGEAWQR